ncbi:MAG: ATP-binding protein [Myxococcaceae bacterium]|nr:ATP-binding protein [Myxococcaceae bacterium]
MPSEHPPARSALPSLVSLADHLSRAADPEQLAHMLLVEVLEAARASLAVVFLPLESSTVLEVSLKRGASGGPAAVEQRVHAGRVLPVPRGPWWGSTSLSAVPPGQTPPHLARLELPPGEVGPTWAVLGVRAGAGGEGVLALALGAWPGKEAVQRVELLGRLASQALERLQLASAVQKARKQAQAEVEERMRAEERYRFLAEAGQSLAGSLDAEVILQELARLAVSRLSDACLVHVPEGRAVLRQVAFATARTDAGGTREARVRASASRVPASALEALLTRRTVEVTEPDTAAAGAEGTSRGPSALLSVPLLARDRVQAVLTLAMERRGRRIRAEDVALAEELAHRAVLAVDNAHLYREAQHARAAAEQETLVRRTAEERQRFLAEASRVLGSTLDAPEILRNLSRLLAPRLADGCAVDLVESGGRTYRVAATHRDPEKVGLLFRIAEESPLPLDSTAGVPAVVRTGVSEKLSVMREEHLAAHARSPEHLALLRELQVGAMLIVPLWVRGKVAGAVTLVQGESGRRFTRADQAVAEDLAGRAGLAVENARLYADLEEEDRRKDEFLAMLAHELRNPLAPVQAAAQLLKQGSDRPEVLERARTVIERQTRHMARLVDDLLDVSRITRGKIDLRRERTQLQTLIQRAAELAHPMLQARQHTLTLECPERPLWLDVDTVRLEQVLVNLLNNAAKYTDPGGRIHVAVVRDPGVVTISVKDTGIGISAEMLERVFDLFTQERRAADRSQGGLGIGLTLVKQLVELHEGSVSAHSEGTGRGSEFRVCLPCPELDERTDTPAPVLEQLSRGLRVLVVDDNVDAAETLAELLGIWGISVRAVHDGISALEEASQFDPEVVLLDIGLPRIDGFEVARRLRSNPAHSRTLLIALTGYGQSEDRARAREAGFDHHLTKPVDLQVLGRLLSEVSSPQSHPSPPNFPSPSGRGTG